MSTNSRLYMKGAFIIMSARYNINLIDGALNYYLGVDSVIEHPQITGYYNVGNNIMKTQYHCYNQIPTNLGLLRSMLTWELSGGQFTESSNGPGSSSGTRRTKTSMANDSCDNLLDGDLSTFSALATVASSDLIMTDGINQASERDLAVIYGVDYFKNTNAVINKTCIVGNGTYNRELVGSSLYHSGGQPGTVFPSDIIQGYTTDEFVKTVGNYHDGDFASNKLKFGVFGTSKVPITTVSQTPSILSQSTTTNVTYDAIVYAINKVKFKAKMDDETQMFGYMHILKYTGNDTTPTQLDGYVDWHENGTTRHEEVLILLNNEDNVTLGTDYILIARVQPSTYTLPNKVYSDGQIVRYFRSQQTGSGDWTNADSIKAHLSPYNGVGVDGKPFSMENKSQFDYANARVKAFPVIFGYYDNDTKPSIIYQFSNKRNFVSNDYDITGENDGFSSRGYGKPLFKPFKPVSESSTGDGSEIASRLNSKYPSLQLATSGYENSILNAVSADVSSGGTADPDSNYMYLDLGYSGLNNTKMKMTGKVADFLGNPLNNTTVQRDNTYMTTVLSGNILSTLVTPSAAGSNTVNTGAVFAVPTGTEPITDLYTSIALVNDQGKPSSNCHLCAYNDKANLYYTQNAYYANPPADGMKARNSDLNTLGNISFATASNYNGNVDKMLYVKMVLANVTGWPAAANLIIHYNNSTYEINGDGNTLTFSSDSDSLPIEPNPDAPTNPGSGTNVPDELVYLKS